MAVGMQGSKQFKQVLLESLLPELQNRGVVASGDTMSFQEKKRAVMLAADAALVNARGAGATRWSRTMLRQLEIEQQISRRAKSASESKKRKRILRRPYKKAGSARALARAMVRKRTRVLKGIVPGGEALEDEFTLLGETLDYAVCLKAQVDVMQLLVRALEAAKA